MRHWDTGKAVCARKAFWYQVRLMQDLSFLQHVRGKSCHVYLAYRMSEIATKDPPVERSCGLCLATIRPSKHSRIMLMIRTCGISSFKVGPRDWDDASCVSPPFSIQLTSFLSVKSRDPFNDTASEDVSLSLSSRKTAQKVTDAESEDCEVKTETPAIGLESTTCNKHSCQRKVSQGLRFAAHGGSHGAHRLLMLQPSSALRRGLATDAAMGKARLSVSPSCDQ